MLKEFNFDQWWKALAAIGGAIIIGAMTVKSTLGALIGTSFVLFGIGQWIDRKPVKVKVTVDGLLGFSTRDEWRWKPSILGVVFHIVACVAFLTAAYLVWTILPVHA